MIDKIKLMNTDFNPEYILDNYKWKEVEIEEDPNKIGKQTNLTNKSRMFGLRMLLTENLKTKTYTLSIDGSIRKWYFNENSRKDLNFLEFEHCIELVGKKLGLKEEQIWKIFKITILEVGVTLLLKSNFRNVMDCFVKYRNAERDAKHETSLYFRFNNYDILFYDKFIEMNKGKIWGSVEKNVFNKFYFLRFEISVVKVSDSCFKKKFDTLELLKSNWNKLPKMLNDYLDKIEFVDLMSKEKESAVETRVEFLNRLCYLGMKSIGIHKTILDFDGLKIPNNKSKYFKDLMNIYKSNISSDMDYKACLMFEFKKKVSRLYNKIHIGYINT